MDLKRHIYKQIGGMILIGAIASFCILAVTIQSVVAEVDLNSGFENDESVRSLKERIKEKQDKIDALKNATEEYKERIEEQRGQAVTLENELGILDNIITKVELDIKTTQTRIDALKLEIESITYQIEKQEKQIETDKQRLIEYIRLIYKNDQRSYLEILILNDSFSEFFSQLNYMEELQAELKNSVDRLKLLKETLEVNRADMERNQADLEQLKLELDDQKTKLKEELKAKEILLVETKNNEELFQRLLVQTRQQQNEIDADILNIEEEIKRKLDRLSRGGTDAKTTLMRWPIDPSRGITAYFHDPDYPYRHLFEHAAIDIRAYQGTQIYAPADGYVARTADNGYGYSYIILIHDNGISTVYGHVSAIYVQQDTFVSEGEIIGLTGGAPGTLGAGRLSTGPHLHLEVRLNGIPVNPLDYLP